ncbi:MAG TPA: hypothetical protein VJQ82_21010, partial [Terriglobales bacterium]|nr:hypothetical protein [Terriglobales bacterium]
MPSHAPGPSTAQAHAWAFRYAPHLGYHSPALPLFRHCAQSVSPTDQAEHVRSLGLHGVQYPWAVARPASERASLAERLHNFGLACGCIAWAPMDVLRTPLWIDKDSQARKTLKDHLEQALQVALQMGSKIIAVLGAAEGSAPLTEPHRRAMAENLRWA